MLNSNSLLAQQICFSLVKLYVLQNTALRDFLDIETKLDFI